MFCYNYDQFKKKICYILGLFLMFIIIGCNDERIHVTLAIKQGNERFLLAHNVKDNISNGLTPKIVTQVQLIEDDGAFFVTPSDLDNVANLVAKNYTLYRSNEEGFDGYVSIEDKSCLSIKYEYKNTAVVGKQKLMGNIQVIKPDKTLEISWEQSPKLTAHKKCIKKSLWVDFSDPVEGMEHRDFILVPLDYLLNFYDYTVQLEYNKQDKILYVIPK